MSDNTAIEWADATANYVSGCDPISPGCTNCFAMHSGERNLPGHPSTGLTRPTRAGHVWTGEIRVVDKWLDTVLRWRKPRRIFWNSHGDLFHEAVPDEVIDRQFAIMAATPRHIHMVLTKRPERMRRYFEDFAISPSGFMTHGGREPTSFGGPETHIVNQDRWPLPNVWLGTSVEDQTRADERIPDLLATPAAVRFISAEPLLGPVDLSKVEWDVAGYRMYGCLPCPDDPDDFVYASHDMQGVRWVIVGGESGPNARPMHPDWARSLRDQCTAAGVPFFFKQWGEWLPCVTDHDGERLVVYSADETDNPVFQSEIRRPLKTEHGQEFWRVGKKAAGRLLDGVQHDGFPGGAS